MTNEPLNEINLVEDTAYGLQMFVVLDGERVEQETDWGYFFGLTKQGQVYCRVCCRSNITSPKDHAQVHLEKA